MSDTVNKGRNNQIANNLYDQYARQQATANGLDALVSGDMNADNRRYAQQLSDQMAYNQYHITFGDSNWLPPDQRIQRMVNAQALVQASQPDALPYDMTASNHNVGDIAQQQPAISDYPFSAITGYSRPPKADSNYTLYYDKSISDQQKSLQSLYQHATDINAPSDVLQMLANKISNARGAHQMDTEMSDTGNTSQPNKSHPLPSALNPVNRVNQSDDYAGYSSVTPNTNPDTDGTASSPMSDTATNPQNNIPSQPNLLSSPGMPVFRRTAMQGQGKT